MKYSILILITLFSFSHAFSQNISISGTVESAVDRSTFPGATVILLNPSDSSLFKGTITDIEGNFKLEQINPGNYILQVQFIGFENYFRNLNLQKDLNLGRISLQEETTTLNEVIVVGKEPVGIQKGDTTQFNASSFKTLADASSQDLVEKMPGITLLDGKIQAQGEDVQQILVDGKPFFGTDVNAALQNLPAGVVASIQIFDKKSDKAELSGFDDGESIKTINIVTRPDRKKGQFGKATIGYGTDDRYQAGTSINLFNEDRRITITGLSNNINAVSYSADPNSQGDVRTQNGIINTNSVGLNFSDEWGEKIEISGSYQYSHRENEAEATKFREYVLPSDSGQVYTENSFNNRINEDHRFNMRFEYNPDERNRILIRPNVTLKHDRVNSFFTGLTENDFGRINETENTSTAENSDYDFDNRIYYSHKFNKKGRSLTLHVETGYHTNEENGTRVANNVFYNAEDSLEILNQTSIRNRTGLSWETQASYTEPIGKHGMVEIEYEVGNKIDDSDKLMYNILEEADNTYSRLDTALSNTFESQYLTHQAEIGYQLSLENFKIQVETEYQLAKLENDQVFPQAFYMERSFNSVLPSVRADYKFTDSKNIEFDYHTWTQEPSIGQLQDVIDNSNPLQLYTGNPNLDQSYNHWIRARYRARNPETEQTLYASIESSFASNYVGNSTFIAQEPTELQDGIILEEGSQLSQPVNLDGYYNFRSYFSYGRPLSFIKSNLGINAGIGHSQRPGMVNEETNFSASSNFRLGVSLSSNISDQVDFNISTRAGYNLVENSLRPALNNNYYNQTTRFRSNIIFWKGFVYRVDLNHQLNTGLAEDIDNSFLLLNMSLGKKFLKNDLAEVSINVYDLLEQNNNVNRNISELYIEDTQSTVLQRYFMLTLSYNFRHFSKGASMKDFEDI